jgi:hypothetical protein
MNNLNKKATPWVSYFVLAGCMCITGLLVYVSQQAQVIGDGWIEDAGAGQTEN